MRRRLSTTLTLFWRAFAAAWMTYFTLLSAYGVWGWLTSSGDAGPPFRGGRLIALIIFGLASGIFVQVLAGSLKRVVIEGDKLLVSNYLKEVEVPLSQVRHVDGPDWSSLRRITLVLREPSEFGEEITFAPGVLEAGEVARALKCRVENQASRA